MRGLQSYRYTCMYLGTYACSRLVWFPTGQTSTTVRVMLGYLPMNACESDGIKQSRARAYRYVVSLHWWWEGGAVPGREASSLLWDTWQP
jgi:hypothetical protein